MTDEEECSRWRMKKNIQDVGCRRMFKTSDEGECSRCRMKKNLKDDGCRR